MKRTATVLIVTFAASAAWAQATGAGNPTSVMGSARTAVGQVNKASGQAASTPARPAAPAATRGSSESLGDAARKVATPIKGTAVPPKPAAKKAAPAGDKQLEPVTATTPKPNEPTSSAARKRDPFVSPIVSRVSGPAGCAGGKKCLVVDQVSLKGVVKAPNGMIAVIVNPANKAYFMRENDPVYNGFVVKITPDSIVFRETVTDRIGRSSTREVVKKVNTPAV